MTGKRITEINDKPLVSIITPTYNHERFIDRCIRSVQDQSYSNWEQIIIDDASKDGTAAILKKAARGDRRVKVIFHEANWGAGKLGDIYNQALKVARGEIVAILEGDDFWLPYKLDKQVCCFHDAHVVLVWGKTGFSDQHGRILGYRPKRPFPEKVAANDPPGSILEEMLFRNIIPPVSVLMRKSALARIGGFKHHYGFVDYPTFLEMSMLGKFAYVQDLTGCWRRHPAQSTAREVEKFALAASQYAQNFVSGIPKTLRDRLDVSPALIKQRENKRVMFAFLFEARVGLALGAWQEARASLQCAFLQAPVLWKMGIIMGFFLTHWPLRLLIRKPVEIGS